uniref:Fibrinogen C-terminal domain-containing protein n=1 Tax=Leptobrachium leishanense TaxID=445787 RepID=A0A8C5WM37_9ANUR
MIVWRLFVSLLILNITSSLSYSLITSCHFLCTFTEVKIVGIGDTDKLSIIRGCPGIPGPPGQKGDTGQNAVAGSVGRRGTGGAPPRERKKNDMDLFICLLLVAKNCKKLLEQGNLLSDWYTINPDGETPMKVLCDMHTDGGGWIVFQRRWDGSVDFYRDWNSYKKGFGSRLNEFWLGNDNLSKLTSTGTWELRIDLQDFEETKHFAKYKSFKVLDESVKYKLLVTAYTDGNAGDGMEHHNNMPFSTKDNDSSPGKCVVPYKGGWWYNSCHNANLNGLYHQGKHQSYGDGINWQSGKGYYYSYKYSEMKIRPAVGQ